MRKVVDNYGVEHEVPENLMEKIIGEPIPKLTVGEKLRLFFGSIKLNFSTSAYNRYRLLNQVNKNIVKTDYKDTEMLSDIFNKINRYDLVDSRFGKTIDPKQIELYLAKVAQNGNNIMSNSMFLYLDKYSQTSDKMNEMNKEEKE